MRISTRLRALVGGSFAAMGVITIGAGLALAAGTSAASAAGDSDKKDYVCKYVGTPGVNERLQTGNNPIWVATDFPEGALFTDGHGRSFVLIADTPRLNPEPDPSACPDLNLPVDETEPADPETLPVDETEPADPETLPVDETEPADPETLPADETEPADPDGTNIPAAGDHTNTTHAPEVEGDTEIEAANSAPSKNAFAKPVPAAVPTAVAAGVAAVAGVADSGTAQGDFGPLLAVLGALMVAGGLLVTVTGRTRGVHQL